MPIIVNLDVMMARRKTSLTDLSESTGITMANLSLLKNGKSRGVRFETLHLLCKFLECTPGDIIEFISEEEYKKLMGMDWDTWVQSNQKDQDPAEIKKPGKKNEK